jgi:hypothetical protein
MTEYQLAVMTVLSLKFVSRLAVMTRAVELQSEGILVESESVKMY